MSWFLVFWECIRRLKCVPFLVVFLLSFDWCLRRRKTVVTRFGYNNKNSRYRRQLRRLQENLEHYRRTVRLHALPLKRLVCQGECRGIIIKKTVSRITSWERRCNAIKLCFRLSQSLFRTKSSIIILWTLVYHLLWVKDHLHSQDTSQIESYEIMTSKGNAKRTLCMTSKGEWMRHPRHLSIIM